MSEEGFERFDKVVDLLKANDIYEGTELKEAVTITTEYTDKWATTATHKLTGKGSTTKMDNYTKVNNEACKINDLNNFSFEFVLKVGDKLPSYSKLFKVSDGEETSLTHKEGEVLLIDIWATWCGPCQRPMDHNQKMLEQNAEAWKDKARIVAVSVDEDLECIRERIEKKKWNNIEHLTLMCWNNEHGLVSNFKLSGIPFVILVDKTGTIDYTGHPSSVNLEQRINDLINGVKPAAVANDEEEDEEGAGQGVGFETITEASYKAIR